MHTSRPDMPLVARCCGAASIRRDAPYLRQLVASQTVPAKVEGVLEVALSGVDLPGGSCRVERVAATEGT